MVLAHASVALTSDSQKLPLIRFSLCDFHTKGPPDTKTMCPQMDFVPSMETGCCTDKRGKHGCHEGTHPVCPVMSQFRREFARVANPESVPCRCQHWVHGRSCTLIVCACTISKDKGWLVRDMQKTQNNAADFHLACHWKVFN